MILHLVQKYCSKPHQLPEKMASHFMAITHHKRHQHRLHPIIVPYPIISAHHPIIGKSRETKSK